MKEFNLSAIFAALAESPNKNSGYKSKFWKSPKKEKTLLKNGGVLMCNNLEDAEVLNNLISQKVKNLKTIENVYVKDISTFSNIILRSESSEISSIIADDTYAEVFDSLNVEEPPPPPLPLKKCIPKPPARPPYSSSLIQKRESRTI